MMLSTPTLVNPNPPYDTVKVIIEDKKEKEIVKDMNLFLHDLGHQETLHLELIVSTSQHLPSYRTRRLKPLSLLFPSLKDGQKHGL